MCDERVGHDVWFEKRRDKWNINIGYVGALAGRGNGRVERCVYPHDGIGQIRDKPMAHGRSPCVPIPVDMEAGG